jgi:hypothetical protein
MFWTLREESFRCFEKVHGPRAYSYREWFYCKLAHLLTILVFKELEVVVYLPDGTQRWSKQTDWPKEGDIAGASGPQVQPDDVEPSFVPEDNDPRCWGEIVDTVCAASGDHWAVLEGILARRKRNRAPAKDVVPQPNSQRLPAARREWNANRERNRIIRNLLTRGADRPEICQELDRQTIPLLPILRKNHIRTWVDGWNDETFRQNIQQLFTKVGRAQDPVKS